MNPIPSRAALILAALALPLAATAQTTTPLDRPVLPVAAAAPRTGDIAIDGRLDEAAWQNATPITAFRQRQPHEGEPASLPTEVRILFGPAGLYIGARMTQPGGVVAPLARRDQLLDASGDNGSFNSLTTDKLIIQLDPYHNRLDEVWFEVNPAGVKGDQFNGDPSWDPIWDAATHVDSAGWSAELRIPFSQLRFSRDSVQTWGMQIWRYIDHLNEQVMWSFRRLDEQGGPAFYGQLEGIRITSRPRQLELLPYLVTGSRFRRAEPGDPYHDGHDARFAAGADLKLLLTSNLTLDATFNPDFGQVEVDPAVLNLSTFETFYAEKRPFFIAGASAFRFGGMRCIFCSNTSSLNAFYSRRIGRPPQLNDWVDDNSDFADTPDNTTILGAAKITGRTAGGYSIGLLNALTGRETARYRTAPGEPERSQVTEPLTNYFVGRVRKEFHGGATTFGGIFTSTIRRLRDPVLADRLRSHAEVAGFDWYHSWHGREYSWMGSTLISSVSGSPAAIARTQHSSARYFRRPDRTATGDGLFRARYDTTATALRGYGLFTRVAKDNGRFLWEAMANIRSPGFETNDLAWLDRADYVWFNGNIARQWTTPTRWYRNIFTSFGGATQLNYDGDRTLAALQAYYGMELPNYWNIRIFGIRAAKAFDERLTRGGLVVRRHGYDVASIGVSTDARHTAVLDFSVEAARGRGDGTRALSFRPGLALKPAPNIFIQLSPTWSLDESSEQYVDTFDDPTAAAFHGKRYVFAFIRTRTLSLDTRVNWTFSPDLTLQLFAQPFIASGDYSSFREFAAPRSITKLVYGRDTGTITRNAETGRYTIDPDGAGPALPFSFDDPSFTDTSLRGTAVLRWEYRPGSTIFFVWTQERAGSFSAGTLDLASAGRQLLRDRPLNVFQIKATYWIGR